MSDNRKNLLDVLAFLRAQRTNNTLISDIDAEKKAVDAANETLRTKLKKGFRLSKAAQSVSGKYVTVIQPDFVMRVVPHFQTINHTEALNQGALFMKGMRLNYVIAQSFYTTKGRIYVVRLNDRPEIIVFTAHFFDRWSQRLETDKERLELVAKIAGIYQDEYTVMRGKKLIPVYDPTTLEQFFVLNEGLCLGYALPLPLQDDLLFLNEASKARHKKSVLVLINTFVTHDMVTEEQLQRMENLFEAALTNA